MGRLHTGEAVFSLAEVQPVAVPRGFSEATQLPRSAEVRSRSTRAAVRGLGAWVLLGLADLPAPAPLSLAVPQLPHPREPAAAREERLFHYLYFLRGNKGNFCVLVPVYM